MPKKTDNDDYEVIPLTPIRKLEKRLESMETKGQMSNFERLMDKMIDMVELNQRIVDEVIKANTGLREDLAVLVGKMDGLQEKIGTFIDIISAAGKEEEEESDIKVVVNELMGPLLKEMKDTNRELIAKTAESNSAIVEALSSLDKRLKRMQIGGGAPPRPTNIPGFGSPAPAPAPRPSPVPRPTQ